MSGEDEVHLLGRDGSVYVQGSHAIGDEALDSAVRGLGGTAGDVVETRVTLFHRRRDVLRDVVEVEDVGERGGEHHGLLVAQAAELGGERF